MSGVTVVKIGGALLENADAAAARILALESSLLAVVHGGGVQITRMLARMNVQSQFIDGLRVTDEVTLQCVTAALMSEVQPRLVSSLQRAGGAGAAAIGVFGVVRADLKSGPWGLVGTNVTASRTILDKMVRGGMVPVIPTLALDNAIGVSSLLNVNGDETATAVALALAAERLVFLTDVEGVRDANGATILRVPREVSLSDAPFVSGGMKPKLRAVEAALSGGVASVWVGGTLFGDVT